MVGIKTTKEERAKSKEPTEEDKLEFLEKLFILVLDFEAYKENYNEEIDRGILSCELGRVSESAA